MAHLAVDATDGSTNPKPKRDWPFEVRPLHHKFGCEIVGISLDQVVEEGMFAKAHARTCPIIRARTRVVRGNRAGASPIVGTNTEFQSIDMLASA